MLDRNHEPAWYVVKGLFGYCYPPQAGEVTVGAIAEKVNELLVVAGEERLLKARKVGAIFKMLGVKTMSLGNWGRGIEFTAQFHRKSTPWPDSLESREATSRIGRQLRTATEGLPVTCVWNSI